MTRKDERANTDHPVDNENRSTSSNNGTYIQGVNGQVNGRIPKKENDYV
jgi:hypothetical protein